MKNTRLAQVLEELASDNVEIRKKAIGELEELGREGLTLDEGRQALAAAAWEWPRDEGVDPSQALVLAALSRSCEDYLELIIEGFPGCSVNARWELIRALVKPATAAAAATYVVIVERYVKEGILPPAMLTGFAESAKAIDVLLPDLLQKSGSDELGYKVQLMALQAAQNGRASRRHLAPFASRAVDLFRPMHERMRKHEQEGSTDWIWSDEYAEDRPHATLLLDLMGFLPGEAVLEALEAALESHDPRVQHFAVLSLIRHGRAVPARVLNAVARSPEMRNWLYDGLASLDRLELFPSRYATQEEFAESNMVDWLIFPTELGRAPHEIELMATFENADGDQRYYLYRFRTHAPHWAADNGWIAGLSGPFEVAAMPTTQAGGSTFSTFTKWDTKTAQEHFEEISGLIAKNWRRMADEISGQGET